jgi:hypothetical protein
MWTLRWNLAELARPWEPLTSSQPPISTPLKVLLRSTTTAVPLRAMEYLVLSGGTYGVQTNGLTPVTMASIVALLPRCSRGLRWAGSGKDYC